MKRVGLMVVERAFPFRDYDRGDPVADEIGERPALRHEFVDALDGGDADERDRWDDRERRYERGEARARHARLGSGQTLAVASTELPRSGRSRVASRVERSDGREVRSLPLGHPFSRTEDPKQGGTNRPAPHTCAAGAFGP